MAGASALIPFRGYQEDSFWDRETKTVIEHWSRQIGKSYTYAAWAVDRLVTNPGRLVTVLSNSRDNGGEFMQRVREVCETLKLAAEYEEADDLTYEGMRFEVRITLKGKTGRIKVLAANPRTARGFSGDLILDEFAFHENSRAIWDAAEPIISSNPDFLCRILSTGNGRRNMFYQLIAEGRIKYRRIRRSDAWATGELKISSQVDGREITPDEAREESGDKRSYDRNYECSFDSESAPAIPLELIVEAERPGFRIDRQIWSGIALDRMRLAEGRLEAGFDVGRSRDLSVMAVLERDGRRRKMVGLLEMDGVRLPDQQRQLDYIIALPKFARVEIDMTGIGLGLFEYAEQKHGSARVRGVNFGTSEPVTRRIQSEGRKAPNAKVTEIMASDLCEVFEDRNIEIIADLTLREDLHKPEKVMSANGKSVSIAASRDADGHADRFWALALAVRAGQQRMGALEFDGVTSQISRLAFGTPPNQAGDKADWEDDDFDGTSRGRSGRMAAL